MTLASDNLKKHQAELGRAAAVAMEQNYDEALDICSELLTSGVYEELAQQGHDDDARRAKAETRLLMATAMHYSERDYQDIARVLSFAMDSPPEIQKDVQFTLAVVHLSFGQAGQARECMQRCLEIIAQLRAAGGKNTDLKELAEQEREAREFLQELPAA